MLKSLEKINMILTPIKINKMLIIKIIKTNNNLIIVKMIIIFEDLKQMIMNLN